MNYYRLLVLMVLLVAGAGALFAGGQGEDGAAAEPGVPTVTFFTQGAPEGILSERMVNEMESETGVNLEFEEPPQQNYAERLQILLASGDYPDMIFFPNKDRVLIQAARDGIIIPLNDLLEDAPSVWEHTLEESWVNMQVLNDGDIYAVPRNTIARADGYAVRRDWAENLGLEWPADNSLTLDEFTEWIRAFTEEDPDGNGEDDTKGIYLHAANDGRFGVYGGNNTPLYWPFGILGWQKYGDEYMNLMYSRDMPNMKNALAYMNEIYEDGYVNPDMVVADRSAIYDEFLQGRYGMFNEFGGNAAGYDDDVQEFDPNGDVDYLVGIENEEGVVQGGSYGTGVWGFYTISSTSENPEAVMRIFEWAFGEGWERIKWGWEGITYEETADGRVKFAEPNVEDEQPVNWWGSFVRRADDPEFFVTGRAPNAQEEAIENIDAALDAFVVSLDLGYVPEAALEADFIEADDALYETIGRIVIGELPVDAYDDALDTWYDNGGAEYVAEMQQYIESVWED